MKKTLLETIKENFTVLSNEENAVENCLERLSTLEDEENGMSKYRITAINILEHLENYNDIIGEQWFTEEDILTDLIENYNN